MTHTCVNLSIFFEVFFFHEIAWKKYQKFLIFGLRYFMNGEGVTTQWTWNNMSWECLHCKIMWIQKSSSNVSWSYLMLNQNGNNNAR